MNVNKRRGDEIEIKAMKGRQNEVKKQREDEMEIKKGKR
jgi:hypothetical protein